MIFHVNLGVTDEGEYVADCNEIEAQGRGLSATAALDRLRDEIRYHVEYCPCTIIGEDWIELEILNS